MARLSTIEQLNKVHRLEQKVRENGAALNHLYSTVISILVAPALFDLFFIYGFSPFHNIFKSLEASTSGNCEMVAQQATNFLDELSAIATPEGLDSLEQMLTAKIRAVPPHIAREKRKELAEGFNILERLRKQVNTETKEYSKKLSDHIKANSVRAQAFCTEWNAAEFLVFPKILFTYFFKYLVIAPSLQRLFPSGLWPKLSAKPILPKKPEYATERELAKYISDLDAFNARQQVAVKQAWKIAAGTAAIYLAHMAYNYLSPRLVHTSPIPGLTTLVIATTVVGKGINFARGWYKGKTLSKDLIHQQTILKNICGPLKLDQSITPLLDSDLTHSYLKISFASHRHESELWAKLLHHFLLTEKIPVYERGARELYIRADFKIAPHQITSLNNKIREALLRLEHIGKLKKQLERIFGIYQGGFHFSREFDKENLPTGRWEGAFPKAYEEIFIPFLQIFFKVDSLQLTVGENEVYFNIISHTQLDPSTLNEKLAELKQSLRAIQQRAPVVVAVSPQSDEIVGSVPAETILTLRPARKAFATTEKVEEIPQKPMLRWKSGEYDFNATDNKVVAITNSHAPAFRQFLLWNLRKEDFPSDEEYQRFYTLALTPIVVSAKNAQGIKYTSTPVQSNRTGIPFNAAIKLKALGAFGALRAYGRQELAPTGESLYVIEAISLKHS
jgi:hypothetical protein